MKNKLLIRQSVMFCLFALVCCHHANCQRSRPGLKGMTPSKWITIKNTQAPGRQYHSDKYNVTTYSNEDIYFKAWIPVLHFQKFNLLVGPHYRTEQMDYERAEGYQELSNWNLRSAGLDFKSLITLKEGAHVMVGVNMVRSGFMDQNEFHNIPTSFNISAAFISRKSDRKEVGYGFFVNKRVDRINVLPAFIFNYNFSEKQGVEISLPYKMVWRHNVSKNDIINVKAEGSTRNYYMNMEECQSSFMSRTDLDLGFAYNKRLNKLVGFELFTGYRRNLRTELPDFVTPVKTSGLVFSMEVFLMPPTKK